MNDKHRAEALGVGLLGLGALLVLAILPPILRGGVTDPNLIGPAGSLLYSGLAFLFGGTSILVSVPAFTWGMERLGVIGRETAIRWSVFIGGALLFLPSAWWMVGSALDRESVGAGWLGMQLGGLLVSVFGTIGAALIVGSILLALTVLAFGWSPAESAGSAARGVNRGMGALGRGAVVTAAKIREVVPSMMARDPDSDSPWERTSVAEETSEAVPEDEPPAGSPSETGKKPTKRKKTKKAEVAESATVDGTDLSDPGDPSRTELPPLDLLTLPGGRGHGIAKSELERLGAILIEKLATFRVDGRIGGWTTGPVVTQFEVVPAAGVKVGQIAALADDLALAMKAPSVRIVAPIPGKGAVGVEVPNPEPEIVQLREILEAPTYRRSRAQLPLAMGRDLAGNPYTTDLARMPHMLIAGATGSGKSVCINTIVTSLIYRYTPNELRLLMVDPKMV